MAQAIPKVQTDDRNINQLQTNINTALNPILSNPINSGTILNSISLTSGSNTINHGLNKKLQGWFIIGINGVSSIYDTQSSNSSPDKTLQLVSSSNVSVNVYVF